jgi:hypothetical protein
LSVEGNPRGKEECGKQNIFSSTRTKKKPFIHIRRKMSFQGKIVIVAGAPCSGKGTQSKSLSKKNGMIHISAGDLARCL